VKKDNANLKKILKIEYFLKNSLSHLLQTTFQLTFKLQINLYRFLCITLISYLKVIDAHLNELHKENELLF